MNYEARLERLEQQIAAPIKPRAIARLYDGDMRPADRMEVQGQRFDRGPDEDENGFRRRVLQSLGMTDWHVIVVHFVGSDGNSGLRFPDDTSVVNASACVT